MFGNDLTILVALAAGVVSFLSPCVLPLVPAYIGQLTAIAVASSADGAAPSRWTAFRHGLRLHPEQGRHRCKSIRMRLQMRCAGIGNAVVIDFGVHGVMSLLLT